MRNTPIRFIALIVTLLLGGCRQPETIVINTPVPTSTPLPTATLAPIQVYVTGAVAKPDVYILPPDSRVKQAVEAAGGFTPEADTVAINLAQPLIDGLQINIPFVGDEINGPGTIITPGLPEDSGNVSGDHLININTATLGELDTLPNIGPITAQKIIDYRESNGPFAAIEAIKEIDGIGDGMFAKLRDLITVGY